MFKKAVSAGALAFLLIGTVGNIATKAHAEENPTVDPSTDGGTQDPSTPTTEPTTDPSTGGETQPTDPSTGGGSETQPTDPTNGGGSETQPTDPTNGGGSETQPTDPTNGGGSETQPTDPTNGGGSETQPTDPTNGGGSETQPTDPTNGGDTQQPPTQEVGIIVPEGITIEDFLANGDFENSEVIIKDENGDVVTSGLLLDTYTVIIDGVPHKVEYEQPTPPVVEYTEIPSGLTLAELLRFEGYQGKEVVIKDKDGNVIVDDQLIEEGFTIIVDGVESVIKLGAALPPEVFTIWFEVDPTVEQVLSKYEGKTVKIYDADGVEVTDPTVVVTPGFTIEVDGLSRLVVSKEYDGGEWRLPNTWTVEDFLSAVANDEERKTAVVKNAQGEVVTSGDFQEGYYIDIDGTFYYITFYEPTPDNQDPDNGGGTTPPVTPPSGGGGGSTTPSNPSPNVPTTPSTPTTPEPTKPSEPSKPTPSKPSEPSKEDRKDVAKDSEKVTKEVKKQITSEKKAEQIQAKLDKDLAKDIDKLKKGEKLSDSKVAKVLGTLEAVAEKQVQFKNKKEAVSAIVTVIDKLETKADAKFVHDFVDKLYSDNKSVALEVMAKLAKDEKVSTKYIVEMIKEVGDDKKGQDAIIKSLKAKGIDVSSIKKEINKKK